MEDTEKTSNPFAAHVKLNKQQYANSDAYITKTGTAIGSHMYAIIATSSCHNIETGLS